jgi:hypothetical protein
MRGYLQIAVVILLAATGRPALAQLQASEAELKAAFVYRFLSFVEWPPARFASPKAPLVVAFVGALQVAAEFRSAVQGRAVQNRPIEVRTIGPGETPAGVHAVFVGDAARDRIAALSGPPGEGPLIVSDSDGALDRGATINLLEADDRLRFSVSVDAAERAGLRLNSRLLALATEVRGGRP